MYQLLFSDDPNQAVRIKRHYAALLGMALFTVVASSYFSSGLFVVERDTYLYTIIFFWAGLLLFTVTLRSGLNRHFEDKSLTIGQIFWTFLFFTAVTYMLNDWRGMILMAYIASLSFGFFGLKFRELASLAMVAVLEYFLVILYIFIYEAERIEVGLELLQLFSFAMTMLVMVYVGGAIHLLRDSNKKQRDALEEALELNKTLATTDELTMLYNRRYFMEKLTHQKAICERDGSDFVICFFDLDHFKRINDTFGHHTGDIVLKVFAAILNSDIREVDYAARFGGEEFICLLVNSDIEKALNVTERIRQNLEEYNFSDIAPALKATVSVGVANYRQYGTIQETLTSADHRMYRAKQMGRNIVVSDDDEPDDEKTVKREK